MKNWTDKEIYDWSNRTFGSNRAIDIAIRANKEMGELLSALQNGQMEEARMECADLIIFLAQIHHRLSPAEITLEDDKRTKMEINVKRSWELLPDGSYQHVDLCPICDGGPANEGVCLCPSDF